MPAPGEPPADDEAADAVGDGSVEWPAVDSDPAVAAVEDTVPEPESVAEQEPVAEPELEWPSEHVEVPIADAKNTEHAVTNKAVAENSPGEPDAGDVSAHVRDQPSTVEPAAADDRPHAQGDQQPEAVDREQPPADSTQELPEPAPRARAPEATPEPRPASSPADRSQLLRIVPRPPTPTERPERVVPPLRTEQLAVDSTQPELPPQQAPQAGQTVFLPVIRGKSTDDLTLPVREQDQPSAPAEAPAPRTAILGAGRSMPVRIEPAEQPATPDEPPPAPPPTQHRRRWPWAVLALVVVVAVLAAVVRWVPGVASKVGLSAVGPVTTAAPPPPVTVDPKLRAVGQGAPEPTQAGISAALAGPASNPALATLSGIVVDPGSGDTLWQHGAGGALAPGSTNKLLTAAAALLTLNHQATLTTKVVAGSRPGTAVLVGGGDPTLSSLPDGEQSVYPRAAHLSDLIAQVKRASHGSIKSVYIDQHRYTGDSRAKGWDPADIQAGNWAPIVPAMLDGGRQDPTMAERTPRSANPSGTLLQAFASGIGASPAGNGHAPAGAKVLGEVHSAPIEDLVDTMLTISDNVLAEAVGREVARSQGQPESFEGAYTSVLKVLREKGFDTSGVQLADSSGLSTVDRVPAKLLASILAVASGPTGKDPRTASLRPLLGGLPVAGGTGTLDGRYAERGSSQGKGWVRAKTGTLSGVNTLAGTVQDSDHRVLVFAFMSNGSQTTPARQALDVMAAALRGCGCRG
ncbi:MAG: D-alanyl-D-alanine carboxypeptidase/D-alanyl-D-alanine endopeptidase [Sciscionella sp.]